MHVPELPNCSKPRGDNADRGDRKIKSEIGGEPPGRNSEERRQATSRHCPMRVFQNNVVSGRNEAGHGQGQWNEGHGKDFNVTESKVEPSVWGFQMKPHLKDVSRSQILNSVKRRNRYRQTQ